MVLSLLPLFPEQASSVAIKVDAFYFTLIGLSVLMTIPGSMTGG